MGTWREDVAEHYQLMRKEWSNGESPGGDRRGF
jgi:hypothetical protein